MGSAKKKKPRGVRKKPAKKVTLFTPLQAWIDLLLVGALAAVVCSRVLGLF